MKRIIFVLSLLIFSLMVFSCVSNKPVTANAKSDTAIVKKYHVAGNANLSDSTNPKIRALNRSSGKAKTTQSIKGQLKTDKKTGDITPSF